MAVAPSSTAGISFNMPPNVPMAVRTGSAITIEYVDVMERPPPKMSSKNPCRANCCAREDFGRAIFAITLIPVWNIGLECLR
jgi:hypothetical protein